MTSEKNRKQNKFSVHSSSRLILRRKFGTKKNIRKKNDFNNRMNENIFFVSSVIGRCHQSINQSENKHKTYIQVTCVCVCVCCWQYDQYRNVSISSKQTHTHRHRDRQT